MTEKAEIPQGESEGTVQKRRETKETKRGTPNEHTQTQAVTNLHLICVSI